MVGLKELVLAAGLTSTSLGVGGCMDGLETLFEPEVQQTEKFFACNYSMDVNNNRTIERDEYFGIKKVFGAEEPITVVGIIKDRAGALCRIKIRNAAKGVVFDKSNIIPSNGSVPNVPFAAGQLYRMGGEGDYHVEFYVNDLVVGMTDFRVLR